MQSKALTIYLIAFSGLFAYLALSRPLYNWDLIGYAAAVESIGESDPSTTHRRVFESLRAYVPPDAYKELTDLDEYRRTVRNDAESLRQHVPFYQNKLFYVGAIYAMTKAGLSPYRSMYILSALFTIIGIWLFVFAFRPFADDIYLAMIPPLALGLGGMRVATIATPDAMAFAALGLVAFLFLRSRRSLLFVLPACILIRPDLIVLTTIFCAALFARNWRRRDVAISAAVCVAIFLAANWFILVFRWKLYVHFTGAHAYPLDTPLDFSLSHYLLGLLRNFKHALYDKPFLVYLAVIWLTIVRAVRRGTGALDDPPTMLSILFLGYLVAHYVINPFLWERYFAGVYLVGAVVAILRTRRAAR